MDIVRKLSVSEILVSVELQVFPWQRMLRQTVAADTKYSTEFFREVYHIPPAESGKTKSDLTLY
jgi:hypothetical protein